MGVRFWGDLQAVVPVVTAELLLRFKLGTLLKNISASFMYFPQVLSSLECSRPWKAFERCKPVQRHKVGEEPTVFTSDAFHSVERQVRNEMWLQNTYLWRWQVLSHGRLDSATGEVGQRCDRLAPNMTRETQNICSETALMENVCQWFSGVELDEVDWIWIKVCTGAWRVLFLSVPRCGEC